MEIVYYIINFCILAAIVILFGRKMIVSIFKDRRTRIESELDEAESPVKEYTEPQKAPVTVEDEPDLTPFLLAENAGKIEKLREYAELECRDLTLSKSKKVRKAILELLRKKIAEKYGKTVSDETEAEYNAAMMEEILSKIALTPGDMAYLKHHDVLYVTLTSAAPLDEKLVKRAEEAANELTDKVGGSISFWLREDPELIGGFKFRIGDTVYDATVLEYYYRIKKAIEKIQLTGDDSEESIHTCVEEMIRKTERKLSVYQLGRVISVSDGICWMDGLADIMYGEVVEFECGEHGMVLDIQKDKVGCVIFGKYEHIESYTKVRRAGRIASVPVGDGLLGRVVDAIGNPVDGKGHIPYEEKRPIEFSAPAILDRSAVSRPMHTGIKAIDAMVPIGKGQRELLVGDRQTGKTAIVLDTIINQKGKNVVCIYVGIGQKETTVADFRAKLEAHGALDYTVIVLGSASDSATMQYIAPFAATAMGEYYMYSGRDVLIIYDDLSKHAVAYRELSLLLQRPSGREAYPGDIFYLHSRLLERSAQLSDALGGGSMTALPIIETQAGDISSYIPTNVISITDGQIFLESELFHAGQRPAVNVGLSVSRVGGAAQTKLLKQVSSDLRTKLAQYRELAQFTQFGADMDEETKRTLANGEHLMEALKQACYTPLEDWKQAILLFAVSGGYADGIDVARMNDFARCLYNAFETRYGDITAELMTGDKMDASLRERVTEAVCAVVKEF